MGLLSTITAPEDVRRLGPAQTRQLATEIRDFRDVPEGTGGLFLAVWGLEHGFEGPHGNDRLTVIKR